MIPGSEWQAEDRKSAADRRKLTAGSRVILTLMVLSVLPLMLSPATIRQGRCPVETFYSAGLTSASPGFLFGIFAVASCPAFFFACGGIALNFLHFDPPYVPSAPARKVLFVVGAIAASGFVLGILALRNDAGRFFCATPGRIVIRRGLRDVAHQQSWSDVRTIYASCRILHIRKAQPYPVASISLVLRDGERLPFTLAGSDEQKLLSLKASLTGVDYKFYVNQTVAAENCPPALYGHLWNWLDE